MSDAIKILVTGDFCPINRVEKLAVDGQYASVFNDFHSVFEGNDLNVTDLECPLSDSPFRLNKTGPHQFAHPDTVNLLPYAGINLVVLANNHIIDLGKAGVTDTLNSCRKVGIETIGLGENETEARRYYIKEIKGKKLAVLNFSDNEFLTTPDKSVQANPLHLIHNYQDIQDARRKCDYVLVIVHAGNEFYHLPSPRTKELYRFFVDAGADAVIAHHTHCFSGYEIYREKPVFYGLGNFIYDNPAKQNGDWNEGFVVKLLFNDGKIGFEIIPLRQGNAVPGVFKLDEAESNAFFKKMEQRNQIIQNDDELELSFQQYCQSVSNMYDAFLEPYWGKYIHKLKSLGLFPRLLNRRKRLLYLNLIRCESHRDVLMRLLHQFINR